jgi:hypothetical protein
MHKSAVLLAAALAVGCGPRPEPAGYGAADAHTYVREHRHELEEEINLGSGDAINQLSIVAGCQDLPEMGRVLHRQRAELFGPPTANDEEVAERIVGLLTERPELRCLDLDLSQQSTLAAGRRDVLPRRQYSQ